MTQYKDVSLVISHLEGSSGNFLARLFLDKNLSSEALFRVDVDSHDDILAINGRLETEWTETLTRRYEGHTIIVTHQFDNALIKATFPNAKVIQIYPYGEQLGNVLYNISYKKVGRTLENEIDIHYIQIKEWYEMVIDEKPVATCIDYKLLRSKVDVEDMLGIKLSKTQNEFFDNYQENQLQLTLDFPTEAITIEEFIVSSGMNDWFNAWSIGYVIFMYELTHKLDESRRLWSVNDRFTSWNDVAAIQNQYSNDETNKYS